jgi:hypothetical protein
MSHEISHGASHGISPLVSHRIAQLGITWGASPLCFSDNYGLPPGAIQFVKSLFLLQADADKKGSDKAAADKADGAVD